MRLPLELLEPDPPASNELRSKAPEPALEPEPAPASLVPAARGLFAGCGCSRLPKLARLEPEPADDAPSTPPSEAKGCKPAALALRFTAAPPGASGKAESDVSDREEEEDEGPPLDAAEPRGAVLPAPAPSEDANATANGTAASALAASMWDWDGRARVARLASTAVRTLEPALLAADTVAAAGPSTAASTAATKEATPGSGAAPFPDGPLARSASPSSAMAPCTASRCRSKAAAADPAPAPAPTWATALPGKALTRSRQRKPMRCWLFSRGSASRSTRPYSLRCEASSRCSSRGRGRGRGTDAAVPAPSLALPLSSSVTGDATVSICCALLGDRASRAAVRLKGERA